MARHLMRTQGPRRRLGISAAWLVSISAAVLLVSGLAVVRWDRIIDAATARWRARLTALVEAKALVLEEWVRDRKADARLVATLVEPGAGGASPHLGVDAVLSQLQREKDYRGIWVVNDVGEPFARSEESWDLDAFALAALRSVMRDGVSRVVGPWYMADSVLAMGIAAPAPAPARDGTGASGAVLILLDPREDLFPIVLLRSEEAATTGLALVEHIGDELVVLSPPILPPQQPLEVRIPWEEAPSPGKPAAEQRETFGRYVDARGVAVLGATRGVAGTPWGLLRKVDVREAMADARRQVAVEVGGALAVIALIGVSFVAYRNHRDLLDNLLLARERKTTEAVLRRSNEELEILSQRLLNAQEEERRRISRDLHDHLGQLLTSVKLEVAAVLRATDDEVRIERGADASRLVDETAAVVRDLSRSLRPSLLDNLGLVPTVKWYVREVAGRSGLTVQLSANRDEGRAPPAVELAAFRVIQEALTNVTRHARASQVTVRVDSDQAGLQVAVSDDGVGFEVERRRGEGLGLVGMMERVRSVGGTLSIDSVPGRGTTVSARFPTTPG